MSTMIRKAATSLLRRRRPPPPTASPRLASSTITNPFPLLSTPHPLTTTTPFSLRHLSPFSTLTPSPPPSIIHHSDHELESDEGEGEPWEEEPEVDPVLGDGGDGGGVVLGGVAWGERVLAAAKEILLQLEDDKLGLFAFKVTPRGYVYVRLDKFTDKIGCPTWEEIGKFDHLYKQKLDEMRESGELPVDVGIEISSPGAERLLRVPDDLDRFKDLPMWVQYMETAEDGSSKHPQQREKVFVLDLIDTDTEHCVWKLADVKENKADLKGRPLSRKLKDWRLKLPFADTKRTRLYVKSKT